MLQILSLIQSSRTRIFSALIFLFFFTLPFGTKKFLFPLEGRTIAAETDGVFFFLNDVWFFFFVLLCFFLFWKRGKIASFLKNKTMMIPLGMFLCVAFLSAFTATHVALSVYFFIRLLLGILLGFLASAMVRYSNITMAALGFFLSSVFQSIVGTFQFVSGKSVGLRYLGEIIVNETTRNVARVSIDGEFFLRAYGVMQHANILAASLLVGFLAGMFLLFRLFEREQKNLLGLSFLSGGLFVVGLGIAATFSRSGWIAVFFSVVLLLFLFFLFSGAKTKTVKVLGVVLAVSVGVMACFGWAIVPRASFEKNEPSVNLRVDYLRMGKSIITNNPFLGVGIGNQTEYAKEHSLYGQFDVSRPSDFQPIHNLFLLAVSEVGFFGGVPLGLFFLFLFFSVFKKEKKEVTTLWLVSSLAGLFVFGLFDHFLWTMQSGIVMLWVIVFLLALSLEEQGK